MRGNRRGVNRKKNSIYTIRRYTFQIRIIGGIQIYKRKKKKVHQSSRRSFIRSLNIVRSSSKYRRRALGHFNRRLCRKDWSKLLMKDSLLKRELLTGEVARIVARWLIRRRPVVVVLRRASSCVISKKLFGEKKSRARYSATTRVVRALLVLPTREERGKRWRRRQKRRATSPARTIVRPSPSVSSRLRHSFSSGAMIALCGWCTPLGGNDDDDDDAMEGEKDTRARRRRERCAIDVCYG